MKRLLCFCLALCFADVCFAQYKYRVIEDGYVIDKQDKKLYSVKRGTYIEAINPYYGDYINNHRAKIITKDTYIYEECIVAEKCEDVFSTNVLSSVKQKYTREYILRSLKNNNKNIAEQFLQKSIDAYNKTGDSTYTPWENIAYYIKFEITNLIIDLDTFDTFYTWLIKNIKQDGAFYEITALCNTWHPNKDEKMPKNEQPVEGNIYTLYLKEDGDYLFFYLNNKETLLDTLVKIDDITFRTTEYYFTGNHKYDLSKVTWPRHADGSCDYEMVVRLQSGKGYRASDNLRLRSSGSKAGKHVVTIGKGTQVKVLSIGAEQTIDGITSNWVQVEVQAGAKDRDGKAIAAGTTGWCFGGYLTER